MNCVSFFTRAFVVLAGVLAALSASSQPATERIFLSGRDRDSAVTWEFRCSGGARAGEWATIPVPSNWEMHGFGTLSYHSTTPSESGEYRHRFTLPRAWEGRRIKLVFDGVMTDTRVTVNGQPAGPIHQGGFYRFSYDITELVNVEGENLLEVFVDETSANEGVNKAERTGDYWNFGGIYRPVWIEALPAQAIERVAIDAQADGAFAIDVFSEGEGAASHIEVRLLDAVGREVAKTGRVKFAGAKTRAQASVASPALWTAETPNLYRAEVSLVDASGMVLHRIQTRFGFRTFEIRRGDGFYLNGRRIVLQGANRHSFSATGGRSLSESDHREDIRLMKEMNATAVRMSHYPPDERFLELCDEEGLYVLDELAGWQKGYDTPVGRTLVEAMIKRDVNHPSILLWDNGNEGGWNTELDAEFAKWDPQQRPVLHPWQIFNGVNTAHYRLYPQLPALVAGLETAWRYDPNDVPKQHEQPLIYLPTEFLHGLYDGGAGAGMEDYWTLMRSGKTFGGGFAWAWMDEGVQRPDTGAIDVMGNKAPDGILGPRREKEASFYTIKELWSPVVVLERAIADDFSGIFTIENRYSFTNLNACRFTWELRRMPEPEMVSAGGAAGAERLGGAPHPVESAANRAPTRSGRGVARDAFTDGAQRMAPSTGNTFVAGVGESTLTMGVLGSPNIAPGESGTVNLELPANWREADVLALRIDDPQGRELWTHTWPLPGMVRFAEMATRAELEVVATVPTAVRTERRETQPIQITGETPVPPVQPRGMGVPPMSPVTMNEEASSLVLGAGPLSVTFDSSTGALTAVERGGKRLSLGPGLHALHVPVVGASLADAQGRRQAAPLQEHAKPPAAENAPVSVETRRDGGDVVIACRYRDHGNEGGSDETGSGLRSVEWRVRANGWIDCAYEYAGVKGSTFQGVGFNLPDVKVLAKSWVGEGPYRVWQNRRRGVSLGLWSNRYNDTITGWRGFEYPEFKGFFAGVRWLTLEMDVGQLTVVPGTEGLFVQVMKPDLPPAELQAKTAIEIPDTTLGLLHVIPAIGTKFSRPEEMGPQGQTPAAKQTYSGAFSLRWE